MSDLPALAAAARFERDRRGESYPAKIYEGRISAEDAAIDYQCWCALVEWLDSGNFRGFYGGADPEGPKAPWISWPELEAAAERALTSVGAMVSKQEAEIVGNAEKLVELYVRRARLVVIHRKVQLRRQMIDSINVEVRARGERVEEAA